MILPILYKRTKTGAVQRCAITVTGNEITVQFGLRDGKQQFKHTKCTGKNIGRSNETAPEQQAEAEAKSKWTKKVKSGYVEDKSGVSDIKLPMKIKKYQGQEKNIKFPCLGSPKLNGVNAEYRLTNEGLVLLSRGGERYPVPPHQEGKIIEAMHDLGVEAVNGEMYCHGMFLEDITSATKKHNEKTKLLKFYAFELPETSLPYSEKAELLEGSDFEQIEMIILYGHKGIAKYHDLCVEDGFEGIVIRNHDCRYEYGVRSSDAFKYKVAIDSEFAIESFFLDKNDHPVFWVQNPKGANFKVKPKGTHEQRLQIVEDFGEKYLGKWYTVEFESWSKYGVPLKPVGVGLRKCDADGKPLE